MFLCYSEVMDNTKITIIYSDIIRFVAAFFSAFFLELILHVTAGISFNSHGILLVILTALSEAAVICLPIFLIRKRKKAASIISVILLEALAIWYTIAFFTEDSYKVFMSSRMIALEAGNVITGFGDQVKAVFSGGMKYILQYQLPVAAYALVSYCLRRNRGISARHYSTAALVLSILIVLPSFFLPAFSAADTYDSVVREYSLLQGLRYDLSRQTSVEDGEPSFSFEESFQDVPPAQSAAIPSSAPLQSVSPSLDTVVLPVKPSPLSESVAAVPTDDFKSSVPEVIESETDPSLPVETVAPLLDEPGYNKLDIDFDALASNASSAIKSIHSYVVSQEPSEKNKYTGIFEGKNLILICAEAFSKELIDEKLTPALYRLYNGGIVFEDFYQPTWGGSTSTGEYSFLTGLMPTDPTFMLGSGKKDMSITIGNQLRDRGYFSVAYHDGDFTYYQRNVTHANLGYDNFIGIGNGLPFHGGFPASDLEMINDTFPNFANQQPFSVYYMSISGHASYAFNTEVNDLAVKNRAKVEDMDCSETLKAYFAANMEFEYAMESLLEQLDNAGILNDTVIAICPDHYPYALEKNVAFGSSENCLAELYGTSNDALSYYPTRDHNAACIWCGSLEDSPIIISEPTYSLDLLPTLLNLFGIEFDSRLYVGRDVLSPNTEALVIWNDLCWLTSNGFYDIHEEQFHPNENAEVDDDYIQLINSIVANKKTFSTQVYLNDYFSRIPLLPSVSDA